MPASHPRRETSNHLLSRLSREDFALLDPHLEPIDLPVRRQLEARNRRIEHAYFLESGVASVVVSPPAGRGVEVGLIGREGVTGLAVVMGTDRTPHETFMQLDGAGLRVAAAALVQAIRKSASLHRSLLHYAHAFFVQSTHTAMANARSSLEERLARWLLMARDRVDGDELPVTHEFLAMMLGVRRSGVTVALNILAQRGLIRTDRGVISIVSRKGLEEKSNGAYGGPEAEFRRLLG